ncbi:response regulator receiver protein [Paraburkholderia sp. EG286B]|uniref:response regulator receiver protein n=1 Tax=Paraburkholderia sp. EG286B TaxID=3237011 RepID=UPI0034D32875
MKPEDKVAFGAALAELSKATQDLQRLERDPATSLAALARAEHRYELSRLEWLRCEWQLRASGAHALPTPPPAVGPIMIVGRDEVIRESLAVLLNVNGYGRSKACGFDSWQKFCLEPSQQLIVLDVAEFSRGPSAWFVESFDVATERPHIIALVWPQDAPSFKGKVDDVIAKPLVFKKLLHAIDRISSEAEALPVANDTPTGDGKAQPCRSQHDCPVSKVWQRPQQERTQPC